MVISLAGIVSFLISVVILAIIFWLIVWVLGQIGIAVPARAVQLIGVLIFLILLLGFITGTLPSVRLDT